MAQAMQSQVSSTEIPVVHDDLHQCYDAIRQRTVALTDPLEADDFMLQSMPDVSPAKWHLAHVNWFFETFVLLPSNTGYRAFDSGFESLFNSYYHAVGAQYPRPKRGLLCRPTLQAVRAWRAHVDEHMGRRLAAGQFEPAMAELITLGLHHEQQHQELLLMDIKHAFSVNPLCPSYRTDMLQGVAASSAADWHAFPGGMADFGHGGEGFAYDNETPRHRAHLESFELAARLTSNAEYLAFVEDGGYRNPLLWLSDGWAWVQKNRVRAPLYWRSDPNGWQEFTLSGLAPPDPHAPVCHVSYYEADAFARWAGTRLPGEYELELAGAGERQPGEFAESGRLHPGGAQSGLCQLHGDVWEWTRTAYGPYPGYRPAAGALGEYNAKFMCNQMVMRGACALTPRSHFRNSYRNFFYPHMRWQMGGIRLARDA